MSTILRARFLGALLMDLCAALLAPTAATGSTLAIDAPTSAYQSGQVSIAVSGAVDASQSPAYVSLLVRRGAQACGADSLEEAGSGGQALISDGGIGPGPFSLASSFKPRQAGTYQLCAYLENGIWDVHARAQAEFVVDPPPPPHPCPVGVRPVVRLAGLQPRVVIGRYERFGIKGPQAKVQGSVEVRMVAKNGHGRTFFRGKTRRRGSALFFLRMDYGTPPVRVYAIYLQRLRDGTLCRQTVSRRVRAKVRVYFPSRCFNNAIKPRSIVVACGDGNFQLKDLRWRHWNSRQPRARGRAWVNDCIPYCAVGTFRSYPATVRLTKPRLCRAERRYIYSRIHIRAAGRSFSAPLGRLACGYG